MQCFAGNLTWVGLVLSEGQVYVVDNLGSTGAGDLNAARINRREAQLKFEEFLRVYHAPGQLQQRKYGSVLQRLPFLGPSGPSLGYILEINHCCRDALLENQKTIKVDLQDIKNFDSELGRCLAEFPGEYLPVVRRYNLAEPCVFYSQTLLQSEIRVRHCSWNLQHSDSWSSFTIEMRLATSQTFQVCKSCSTAAGALDQVPYGR